MRRIIRHIELCLYRHECVIVPGFGAFIRHDQSSSLDQSKGLIYPGYSVLSFNPSLRRDDGILVDSYRCAFSLNYKRALSMIEQDVEELNCDLRGARIVQLGNLGKMSLQRESHTLVFYPNNDHPFSISYYGLTSVSQLPPLCSGSQVSSAAPPAKEGVYYLPIRLRSLKYGAAAVLVGAMVLLMPRHTLSDHDQSAYQASFLSVLDSRLSSPDTLESGFSAGTLVRGDEGVHRPLETIAGLPLIHSDGSSPRYYVVIATLSSVELVEKYLRSHPEEGRIPTAGILGSQTLYRLYAGHFATSEEANAYRRRLVEEYPSLHSAWVYKSR